jgi:hypothetical protein
MTVDVFSKYAWVMPIKSKEGNAVLQAFKEILKKGKQPVKFNLVSKRNFLIQLRRKYVYFDELANLIKAYNKTYHRFIQMRPLMLIEIMRMKFMAEYLQIRVRR